jgi:class 3 adenylate cyclase/tetratricopeptide (TPR) repeat protein
MICTNCGAENPAGKRFCGDCGTALATACANCGAENPPGKRFCGDCGAPLGTETAPGSPRGAPTAERRLVTVLFADLVGFTPLSESRDAEEVRELLSRYFDTARRLIAVYGGTVEKFIGDAVMAVWGTPVATEDDAERAVRAGLDLVAAVSALGDDVGAPELRARAGVLTGEAAVTLGASAEGMVAGDLVNTASRIQTAATPGTVLVGDATRRATEQTIVYEDAGEHELKGKAEPVALWRALRIVSGARGQLKSSGLEAPFVGRERELRVIKDLFHACSDDRKAHLISVTGVAGIGKSRIGWEFYKYFDGIVETIWWHRGRCLAYGEGVTYWALADMVRMRCRIAEDEEQETGVEKVRATLLEHILDEEERAFVEPRVLQLLGWGSAEAGDRQQLFAAWRLFFERLSDSNPVALLFEDLQWADESLLDFIEYLLEWSRNHPLFVLTLARPDLIERRPTWGAGQRAFTSIYLEALPREAMEELLDGLVPGMPDAVREPILARAEGVPLYAVETVRMLVDRGVLVEDGASYRVVGEIGSLDVPETLHALIASRLDGLDEPERTLVQDAAVLGKTFSSGVLAALSGRGDEEVEPLLAALVRKEVLTIQADPRSPEHGQYGFLQDLVRRVAYETLSRRERKLRHLAAADQFARTLGEDDIPEVIAAHLLAARDAMPEADDAGEITARAARTFVLAGERAERLAAAGEAQRSFERASQLTEDDAGRARLTDRAGQMAYVAGRIAEASALLERAWTAYDELGDEVSAALVDARLAEIDFVQGHPPVAVRRLEPALEAIERVGAPEDIAAVAHQLGRFLVFTGEFDRAAPHLERALALAEQHDLHETVANALNSKATLLLYQHRPEESRLLVEGALRIALEYDFRDAVLRAYNNCVSGMWWAREEGRASVQLLDEAIAYARRVGDRQWETNFLSGSGGPLYHLGLWDEALRRRSEAEPYAHTEFPRGLLLATAVIQAHRGEAKAARDYVEQNRAIELSENLEFASFFIATDAVVAEAEGREDDAFAGALRSVRTRAKQGVPAWNLALAFDACRGVTDPARIEEFFDAIDELSRKSKIVAGQRARFRARLPGHDPGAELEEAERLFRELEAPFYVAIAQLERAERLAADEAEVLLREARETFERLGAAPWVARVDALRRSSAPVA